MLPTPAYAAQSATSPLAPHHIERREPGPHDVLIEILYCGVCHADIDFSRSPHSMFPIVPGHEIVGRVERTGSAVTRHKVGDMVGVGVQVDSCRACASCQKGEEQYCLGMVLTYNHHERDGKTITYGGFSTHIVVDEHYTLRIPPRLSPAAAAPLLCAGITTYSPLRHWRVGPGSHVGVIGLGGLGHLAVKFAAAMGARVTVLSTSEKKRDDALRLGAHDVVITTDAETVRKKGESFDLILNTVSRDIDHDMYVGLLKLDGVYVQLGSPERPMVLNAAQLLMRRKSVSGSLFGGIAEIQEMLDYCAEHNIVSDIEMIPIDKVNEAFERMIKSDVRYRFVIDMASLR